VGAAKMRGSEYFRTTSITDSGFAAAFDILD
jgi:hypothetical protein